MHQDICYKILILKIEKKNAFRRQEILESLSTSLSIDKSEHIFTSWSVMNGY